MKTSFNPGKRTTALFAGVAATVAISLTIVSSAHAVQPSVDLKSTSNYAVLAGSGITNTGATTVSGTAGGDMGSSPTGSFTGDTMVTTSGTKYTAVDSKTTAAKADLVDVYDDAAGRVPATTITGDLGGQTLVAGVYNSASSIGLTNTVTLDGQNNPDAVFIFQAGSTLTTASNSTVALINGAQACHVFWQVGSSATFGTTTTFVGHVFALTSISAKTGATFAGQLLARNGAVTLDHNTITNDLCTGVTPTGTPSPSPSTSGGPLPNTDGIDWSTPLIIGLVIAAVGGAVLVNRRKRQ